MIQGHEYSVTDNIQEWELILIGLAVGAVVGIVVMFLFKIGFFLIGALAGAFVGVILLSLREGGLVQGDVSAWAIIGCFALIGGILAVLPAIEKLVLVATTSVVGSFGVTAAIDYYANCMAFTGILQQMVSTGDYDPATVTVSRQEQRGDYSDRLIISSQAGLGTWLLFGGTIVLVILGIVVQLFFTGAKHKFVPLANCCSGKSKGGYESI